MSVELDPVELGFRRPFTQEVAEVLRLRNPHSDPVAFKVKTTAPKQYCVRPNSGRIEPGQNVEVQVLLQAMKEDPPPETKCRDKFLVQSVAVSADQELNNVAAIWSNIEQSAKSSIQEKKIRVTFLPAEGGAAASATPARSTTNHDEEYSSPGAAVTPHSTNATPVGAVSYSGSRAPVSKSVGDAIDSANNASANGQSTFGAAMASVANMMPSSSDDVKKQLAEAQATITRLKSQIEEGGLRQRKTESVSQDSSTKSSSSLGTQQVAARGVPVPLVAALCLLSFLLAYFLF